jgi:hypothetical protein
MGAPTAFALLLTVQAALAQAAPAAAAAPVERGWITINVGAAAGPTGFSDTVQTALYQESETIATSYPGGGGLSVSGAGGYRVWRQLSAGAGVSHVAHTGEASIDASLPHPFFDNQPRAIGGTTSAAHDETSIDLKAGWMVTLAPRVRLLLSGGPSIVAVTQTIVTGVTYSESYPFDTAQFTSAGTQTLSRSAVGFNAGADLFWLFSRHAGAGGLVQFTHARVALPASGHAVAMDAGGVQGGGGIRFVF